MKRPTVSFESICSKCKPFSCLVFSVWIIFVMLIFSGFICRKFKQVKGGFRTDAELNGYSWVLRSFLNSTKNRKGGDWIEVKDATWEKVHVIREHLF